MESKIKMLKVLEIISATDPSHPMTASKICKALEKEGISAERKSVCRDINTLISCGYPIALCHDNKLGYYMTKPVSKKASAPSAESIKIVLEYAEEDKDEVSRIFGKARAASGDGKLTGEFSVKRDTLFQKLLEAGETAYLSEPAELREKYVELLKVSGEFYNKPRGERRIDVWLL